VQHPKTWSRATRAIVSLVVVAALVGGVLAWRELREQGNFSLDEATIMDPNGDPFVPVGMNLLGPDAFFNADGVTAGQARVVADGWRANTVRLNMCLPDGCPYSGVQNERNDDLDRLVDEMRDEGLVVMLALHQVKPGGWPTADELDDIEAWWLETARRYRDDPYVWFNVLNEPGKERPADERWLSMHDRLVGAIRDTGADNLVVVDGTSWGQDAGGEHRADVKTENSAILRFGPRLAADHEGVVFSFHVYNQWGNPDATDQERVAKMVDYVRRVRRAGLPVLMGEVGGARKECCEREALAARAAYEVAARLDVGLLAWHGQSVDEHRLVDWDAEHTSPSDIDDWENPSNLTWQGELLWQLARRRGD
jgi:mannan endo-1,4-beta-mannosidase